MLRWLLLILLLCNALLFLWYAQREQTATASSAFSQDQVTRLRLLHELSGGEVVRPLQLECYQVGVFATENEAGQAAQLLAPIAMAVEQFPAPEEVAGYQLAVEIPSQAQAQRELLDRLAIAGWVPQTRQGRFLLGPFTGNRARAEAAVEQRALKEGLGLNSELQPVMQPGTGVLLEVEVSAGTEIGLAPSQLLLRGWPGIKIEKKLCSGLAQSQSDQ